MNNAPENLAIILHSCQQFKSDHLHSVENTRTYILAINFR